MLTSKDYENLHIFGMSETKLKGHKLSTSLISTVFKHPSEKIITQMAVEGSQYMLGMV